MIVQKGGQVTKPIIVVKMPCKLLYVIQVKGFLNFLALLDIRDFWSLITIVASDGPRTFFTARLFLFSISLLFASRLYNYKQVLTRNLICDWILENHSKSHIWYFEKYQFQYSRQCISLVLDCSHARLAPVVD